MERFDRKGHWENIFNTKQPNEVSWYQATPEKSLELVRESGILLDANIIDIGGGDSMLVDHLLGLGYHNLTVLDISASAIERAKKRLGDRADLVTWIVSDMVDFKPTIKYDLWHDRAAFHFLTTDVDVTKYISTAESALSDKGVLILGTFSENGPKKCSGIEIRQYSEQTLTKLFVEHFTKINCYTLDHKTPFDTIQNFVYCLFQKRMA